VSFKSLYVSKLSKNDGEVTGANLLTNFAYVSISLLKSYNGF